MARTTRSRDPILVLGSSGQVYKNTNPIKLDYKVCAKTRSSRTQNLPLENSFQKFLSLKVTNLALTNTLIKASSKFYKDNRTKRGNSRQLLNSRNVISNNTTPRL